MTPGESEGTLLMGPDDGRPRSQARLRARHRAYRIAAECELVTDELSRLEHRNWSDAFGRVLLAARRLIALTAPGSESNPPLFDAAQRPGQRLLDAQTEILGAVHAVSAAATARLEDETVSRALRTIRRLALGLFDTGDPSVDEPAATPAPSRDSALERKPTVLVVEDDIRILQLLERTLVSWGLEVVTAPNGRDGLEIAMRAAIDLILTDIEMPQMDGLTLLENLKSRPATRNIPVIVVSSVDDMDHVTRCIQLGAEDHIPKPFSHQLLSARVRASLERKRLHDAETDALRRITALIEAAEAVERDAYTQDSLSAVTSRQDGLGRLARVFDHMVTTLKSKEERLRRRLLRLRNEVSDSQLAAQPGRPASEGAVTPGEVIGARFEIVGRLGEGGMGTVYQAFDRELGEVIALKMVRRELLESDPQVLDRLKSEIRLARKLSHPNIVRAHDLGEWHGRYYITMEKVQGITVAELLDRRGRLTLESTIAIGTQLCDALAVAHANEIVHRDIKPANLLIDEAGTLKVMDFGIARHLRSVTGVQTGGGYLIGTPLYMAPELLVGGKPDARTDLFSVGVVLYECLTGRLPFDGDSPMELFARIMDEEMTRLGGLVPDLPASMIALVEQQLRFDAQARIQSARELGRRLSEVDYSMAAEPAAVPFTPPPQNDSGAAPTGRTPRAP
jgi:serine/threonine protein kinase/FixJ family two-component response regulator